METPNPHPCMYQLTRTTNRGRHDLGQPHRHEPCFGADVEVDNHAPGQGPRVVSAGVAYGDADDADAVHAVEHGPPAEALAHLREDDDADRIGYEGERVKIGEVVDGKAVFLSLFVIFTEYPLVRYDRGLKPASVGYFVCR